MLICIRSQLALQRPELPSLKRAGQMQRAFSLSAGIVRRSATARHRVVASATIFGGTPKDALQIGMSPKHLPQTDSPRGGTVGVMPLDELPLTVREAAVYLGVSVQTVYLWVERKQIPHLRVMGRNIRFLKSDLEPFRATFKQEVGIAKTE